GMMEGDGGVDEVLRERDWLLANPYEPVAHQRALDDRAEARLIARSRAMEEASRRERAGRLQEIERDLRRRGVVGFAEDGSARFEPKVVRPVVWDEVQR